MALGRNDLVLPYRAVVDMEGSAVRFDASFEERCRAAAAGGFAGLGIAPATYRDARAAGRTDADLRGMLDTYGVALTELEPGRLGGPGFDASLDEVTAIAGALGADHVFFVAPDSAPVEEHAEAFAHACDRVAPHGMRVAVEFMPIPGVSALRDIRDAQRLVELADRPNGGVIFDTYHFVNDGADWEGLEGFDGSRVVGVQLSDGAVPRVVDDYIDDTRHHRAPPGEGRFPLERIVQTLDRIGADAPWEVEVLDDDMAVLALEERGRRLGDATRALLARARA
jgi:sugar phosphate isomerase/epimerase